MSKKFKKRNTAIEGGIAFFLSTVWYLLVLIIASPFLSDVKGDPVAYPVVQFVVLSIISLGFVALSLTFNKILGSHPHYEISKPLSKNFPIICIVVAAIAILGFQGVTLAFNYHLISNGYTASASIDFENPVDVVFRCLHILIVAPVCEEFLMRGTVLSSIVGGTDEIKGRGRILAVIFMDGLCFMLIHMNPLQTVYQLLFGAVLAYVTIKYGSLIPAIIIHVLNNAVGIVLSLPAVDDFVTSFVFSAFSNQAGGFIFVAVSVVLAIVSFALIFFIVSKSARGQLTDNVVKTQLDSGYRAETDDNGRRVGLFLFVLGAIICLIVYISSLIGGLS